MCWQCFVWAVWGIVWASAAAAQNVFVDLSVLDDLNEVSVSEASAEEPTSHLLPRRESKIDAKGSSVSEKDAQKKAEEKKQKAPEKTTIRQTEKHKDGGTVRKKQVSSVLKAIVAIPEKKPTVVLSTECKSESKDKPETPIVGDASHKIPTAGEKNAMVAEENSAKLLSVAVIEAQPAVSEKEAKTLSAVVAEYSDSVADVKVVPVVEDAGVAEMNEVEILEPLIPLVEDTALPANVILFADGVWKLSTENLEKLANFADDLAEPGNGKIMISAYNYDTGDNDFKAKRLNLNRAVEIRSHLMTRGYKNFSIKIISTEDSHKKNTVELTEQKD